MKQGAEYDNSGWLTLKSIQYGATHRQPSQSSKCDVRMRTKTIGQIVVEKLETGTDTVIEDHLFFHLGKARKTFKELVGGKLATTTNEAGKTVIL